MKTKFQKIFRNHWHRHITFINGTRGVISLFLALLMVPFAMLAGGLINAARMNSAVAIFDEALCNASNSSLGTYDKFLKSRFGLMAMQQDTTGRATDYTVRELVNDTFKEYMEQNLKSLGNTYTNFVCEARGVYPLADENVLLNGILEFSKYSVPVKLVEDGFNLNGLISQLENMIPGKGILELITSGVGVANSIRSLADDIEYLKTAVRDEEIALAAYEAAYMSFSEKISSYYSTKDEMNATLSQIQKQIDKASDSITDIVQQLESIQQQIDTLNKDSEENGIDHQEELQALYDRQAEINKENEAALEEYNTAVSNYNNKRAYYESRLASLQAEAKAASSTYIGSVDTLIGKLSDVEIKLSAVKSDIVAVGSAVGGTFIDSVTLKAKQLIQENEMKIKNLNEKICQTDDEDEKAKYQEQIDKLKDEMTNLNNQNKIAEAEEKGLNEALKTMKSRVSDIDLTLYSDFVIELRNLKARVALYDTSDIQGYLDRSIYFVEIPGGILTYEDVLNAENDLVNECTKSSIWTVINAIAGFIKALFSVSTVFDPSLTACINTTYYYEKYGGLPSMKERSIYPLDYGDAEDAEKSDYFKSLFGDYDSENGSLLLDFDLIGTLGDIISDIGVITLNATAMKSFISLLLFSVRFEAICDAITRIASNIGKIIDYLGNVFSSNYLGSQALLYGYASYMTSNRTTYTGKALTGTPFNSRLKCETSVGVPLIGEFQALIETIQREPGVGKDMRFVGAETEYLIFGTTDEIINQSAAFGVIYIIRLLLDLAPVLTNPEVQAIAATCSIAAPVVLVLYIFVEPLAETLILVNGGSVPFYQGGLIYLTPSGIGELVKVFWKLGLTSAELEKSQTDFTNAIGASGYKDKIASGGSTPSKSDSLWNVKYSQFLFVMLAVAVPRDKMLARLSDIIEMEAAENAQYNGVASNGYFDLDKSYTFIRAEASFSANEFINISGENGFTSKTRIIYRGY